MLIKHYSVLPRRSYLTLYVAVLAILLNLSPLMAQTAGKVLSVQGTVEVQQSPWAPAVVDQELSAGAVIRTAERSRAAILLADETQLKLGENSRLELTTVRQSSNLLQRIGRVAASSDQSIMKLESGKAWLRSKKTPASVQVQTPAVTAAIRGTEFVLDVAADGESVMTVVEGSVDMSNDQGAIRVNPGEQGRARIGEAPTKTVILNPEDAVQWTLYYSAAVSPRDYPFQYRSQQQAQAALSSVTGAVQRAQTLHDAGDITAALATLEGTTGPEAAETRGWIYLEQNDLAQAVQNFNQGVPTSPRSRLGLSLAHFRLNEIEQAYQLVEQPGNDARLKLQKATLELIVGDVGRARAILDDVPASDPAYSLVQGLLSNILLAQNQKEEALAAASRAVENQPESPSAYLNLSLVQQSYFDLPAATRSVESALQLDPTFLQAQVQYSKLLYGAGRGARAEEVIRQALAAAPEASEVQSMVGFVLLGQAKTDEAAVYFERATALDNTRGEPHLGLGIVRLRQGQFTDAVAEMLIATTLEPRLSLYQSYLGKAFYEERKFEQALSALSAAKDLDPRDPTPYLYTGIYQNDLNRPGIAVEEYQQSILLNDNRAVYRSRFVLDEDRATRNVQLARAYNRLGLSEWGNLEAIKSNSSDPTSSSAHLFLANTFNNLRGRTAAAGSELLLAQLLLPVNTNSFNAFNDYTTLFERPRINWTTQGTYGSFDSTNGTLVATGGASRFAYSSVFAFDRTAGFRLENDDSKDFIGSNLFKFALTPKSDLLFAYRHTQRRLGDTSTGALVRETGNDTDLRIYQRLDRAEVGYHQQLRPGSELVFHFAAQGTSLVEDNANAIPAPSFGAPSCPGTTPPCFDRRSSTLTPSVSFQASHLLKVADVQFKYGLDIFEGRARRRVVSIFDQADFFPGFPSEIFASEVDFERRKVRTRTVFLQSDYVFSRKLIVTGGLNYDWVNDDNVFIGPADIIGIDEKSNPVFAQDNSDSQWNPQVGVLYSPFVSTTFRFGAMRVLQPLVAGFGTAFSRERLVPAHLNGFPLNQNEIELTRSNSFNFGWDQRLGSRAFIRSTAFLRDQDTPTSTSVAGFARPSLFEGRTYGTGVSWNQFLTDSWTLVSEYSLTNDQGLSSFRRDHLGSVGFFYVSHRGLFLSVRENYLKQTGCLTGVNCTVQSGRFRDVKVFTTDAAVSYEFPRKIGLLSFRTSNLFDRNYEFLADPLALDPRIPRRRLEVLLQFNF